MRRFGLELTVAIVLAGSTASAAPFAWLAHQGTNHVSRIDLASNETVLVPVKRFGAKAHAVFVTRFGRVLRDAAAGSGNAAARTACLADLDPAVPTAKVARLRATARSQMLARCGGLTPADLAQPCDESAGTMAEVADCVLAAQVRHVAETIAAEYGVPCSLATATGLDVIYPQLCPAP